MNIIKVCTLAPVYTVIQLESTLCARNDTASSTMQSWLPWQFAEKCPIHAHVFWCLFDVNNSNEHFGV